LHISWGLSISKILIMSYNHSLIKNKIHLCVCIKLIIYHKIPNDSTELNCNHKSVKVKVMLWLTASQSVCLGVKFTLGLVARYFLPEICCVVSVGHPVWREVGSVSCQSLLAVFSPLSKFNIIYTVHVTCFMYMQYILGLSAQTQVSRSCQNICSLHYNRSLRHLNSCTLDRQSYFSVRRVRL
jgi:hypothetical protein